MILLTDEEIYRLLATEENLVLLGKFGNASVAQEYHDVAKAQLKKDVQFVLDYGEDRFFEECIKEFPNYQALLEEVKE